VIFAQWGGVVFRHRRLVLGFSMLLFVVSVLGLLNAGKLRSPRTTPLEAGRASDLVDSELQRPTDTAGSHFSLVVDGRGRKVDDPAFQAALADALAPLRADTRVTGVQAAGDLPPDAARLLVSKDGTKTIVSVALRDSAEDAQPYYEALRAEVHSADLDITATSSLAIQHDFDAYLARDLSRAEYVSLPLSLLLLLFVFGAVVSALLPVGVGVLTIAGAVGGVLFLAHFTDVNQYALNVVTLIGLGVSIDYSLFVVSRFREELAAGLDVEAALRRTMATAGRAVTFSGLTVAIGLSGLLFYTGTFFTSLGLAGAISVAVAVVYGLTFLPATLAMLGPRVDRLRIPLPRGGDGPGFWHRLATGVMRRPVLVLLPTVGFILLAGLPFQQIRLANGDITLLPLSAESRRGTEIIRRDFPGQDQNTVTVVLNWPDGRPLSPDHVGAAYDLSRRIAAMPNVLGVDSVVDADPKLSRADYQRLYADPVAAPPALARAAAVGVGPHIVLISAHTKLLDTGDEARNLVRDIRAIKVPGAEVLVTGFTAFDIDFIKYVLDRTPLAVAYIMVVTYLVLLLLLGSVVLPIKAVVMNLLSLSASFGALVWIFQQGHLSGLLGFEPASIDPSVPILLFCIVFGLSMDYEVLLLSRMKEEFERTGDNRGAVAQGLERSGRLVSGAAAIMVAVFSAFALADVVLIKSIGLGMAIAVAIDATIVRALIVPATMRLLGNLNWWAPAPITRLYHRLGLAEAPAPERLPD
jgi:RND superfamily putative drug exporter